MIFLGPIMIMSVLSLFNLRRFSFLQVLMLVRQWVRAVWVVDVE